MNRLLLPLLLISVAIFCACSDPGRDDEIERVGEAELALSGAQLFNDETFGGNGRTCASCHAPGDLYSLTHAHTLAQSIEDPAGPLFRPIDSNDGASDNYSILIGKADVRIPLVCAPNVTIDERDENVFEDEQGRLIFVARRATPPIENVALKEPLMLDGREGSDLAHQAGSAVQTHYQASRLPTQAEKEAIAAFQRTKFSSPQLEAFANGGPPPELPPGHNEQERRGRTAFVGAGKCAMCHSGPMLNETSEFNPVTSIFPPPNGLPPGQRITTNLSSDVNAGGMPVYTFHFANAGLFGGDVTMVSPDPGRAIVTGQPCADDPSVCFINFPSAASTFVNPSLWGVAKTAPYFHDGSAPDLHAVMVHYKDELFLKTCVGLNRPDLCIGDAEADDIEAYMIHNLN
jgi:cytochrome c peroxidase